MELTISQLIKIGIGVLVFVIVVIGLFLFFKNYIIDFFENVGLGGKIEEIILVLIK